LEIIPKSYFLATLESSKNQGDIKFPTNSTSTGNACMFSLFTLNTLSQKRLENLNKLYSASLCPSPAAFFFCKYKCKREITLNPRNLKIGANHSEDKSLRTITLMLKRLRVLARLNELESRLTFEATESIA